MSAAKYLLLMSLFISFLLFSSTIFALSCSGCKVGSCSCSISECSSGSFKLYTSSACSGIPSYQYSFSGGSLSWSPVEAGTFYAKVFCDDRTTTSSCTQVDVGSVTTTTTTTTSSGGGCVGCGSGGGTTCREEGHVCTAASPCCAGLTCVGGVCRRPITTTTTTRTTTTTTMVKECPYECCEDEELYTDLNCMEGYVCEENSCVKIETEEPEKSGPNINYYVIVAVILAIAIPVFVISFIFKKKQTEWKSLYEKWSARPKHARRF